MKSSLVEFVFHLHYVMSAHRVDTGKHVKSSSYAVKLSNRVVNIIQHFLLMMKTLANQR